MSLSQAKFISYLNRRGFAKRGIQGKTTRYFVNDADRRPGITASPRLSADQPLSLQMSLHPLDALPAALHITLRMLTTRITIDHRLGNPAGAPPPFHEAVSDEAVSHAAMAHEVVAHEVVGHEPAPGLIRHPEKVRRPDNPIQRKPAWIRVKAPNHPVYHQTRSLIRDHGLVTVCEEAACPNIGECWSKRHATMMIMGDTCTRACAFCNVRTGQPAPLQADEPVRLADAVAKLGLRHVVITSVDRDDLPDGGAAHFARVILAIRDAAPGTTIEVLTPDFLRKPGGAQVLAAARPDVFNHNLETVPRLYPTIRPGARYYQSLRLLDQVKQIDPSIFTKSGLMVGLGETRAEIMQVMDDLRIAGIDFLTIGQYLQPTVKHAAVERFVPPDEFAEYAAIARGKGFLLVSATPLTRSSYHADDDFAALRDARAARLAEPAT